MRVTIKPGAVHGTVRVPPSKSLMQRACAAALIHPGRTVIRHPGQSDDDRAALRIIGQLGARILREDKEQIEVLPGKAWNHEGAIDCGESGLSARLFTPLAALGDKPCTIRGEGSLLRRPMDDFGTILPLLGVNLRGFAGRLPFTVQGPLVPGDITIDGSLSSQFLSGLLFAFAAGAERTATITVNELSSRPYIDLTLEVLEQIGRPVRQEHYQRFVVAPELFEIPGKMEITVAPDWSSAAVWIAAGVCAGEVALPGLGSSRQADAAILPLLQAAGADLNFTSEGIVARKSAVSGFAFDATDCPDLFPVLAVLAAGATSGSRIRGLHRLRHKESDRQQSISAMLHAFGINFSLEGDELILPGGQAVSAARIDGCGDHRIVMAAALAALSAKGEVVIEGAEAVSKSYPGFFQHLAAQGVQVQITD